MGPKTASEKLGAIEVSGSVHLQDLSAKNPVTLENAVDKYDITKRHVIFPDIKVSASTRMNPVSIVFHAKEKVKGKSGGGEVLTTSILSHPLIVITNESQWCDAATKLFLLELFPDRVRQTLNHHSYSLFRTRLLGVYLQTFYITMYCELQGKILC
jgi:hypothetical protein